MKKVIFFLSIMMLTLASCGSKGSNAKLKVMAEQANAMCPMPVDQVTTLTSVDYNESSNDFIYTYSYDEVLLPLSGLKENADVLAQQIIGTLTTNPQTQELIEMLNEADADLIYTYVGNEGGGEFSIVIDPATSEYKIK